MSVIPAEVDVVVAGSGAAGLAAATTLAAGGARVAVFEKQRSLGGTSNFFRGTFGVETEMQRERFVDYSRDEAFRNIMEYSHWIANARLVRAIVDESASTIAWLREQGVEFTGELINMPRAPQTYHVVQGDGRGCCEGPRDPGEEQRALQLVLETCRSTSLSGKSAGVSPAS